MFKLFKFVVLVLAVKLSERMFRGYFFVSIFQVNMGLKGLWNVPCNYISLGD